MSATLVRNHCGHAISADVRVIVRHGKATLSARQSGEGTDGGGWLDLPLLRLESVWRDWKAEQEVCESRCSSCNGDGVRCVANRSWVSLGGFCFLCASGTMASRRLGLCPGAGQTFGPQI